jgi:hypothetical protein
MAGPPARCWDPDSLPQSRPLSFRGSRNPVGGFWPEMIA